MSNAPDVQPATGEDHNTINHYFSALKSIRERSHMTSAAEGGGGFEMLTVADKGGRGSKPC